MRVLTISKPYVAAAYRRKLSLLQERGFTIGLICPPAWAGQTYEPSPRDADVWIKRLPIVLDGKNHFHFYRGLERAVAEFRPDVLNVEEEHYSLVTYQAFRVARKVGARPLFYTWQNIMKHYPPPFSWIEKAVFRAAAAGVCGNQEAVDVLRTKGFQGPAPEIPQMGVTLGLFEPDDPAESARAARRRALGLVGAGLWTGFFGRLVEEKGLASLLKAMAHLPDQRLLVVGSGPERAALEAQAIDLGITGRVKFLGPVRSEEVASYLKAVDVLCLPSLTRANWKEQFGRVLVEAMAAEALVVGSSSGEIPRVIADAGLVFPEGDAEALAEQLRRLGSDAALREEIRTRARQRVRRLYSNDVVADRWAELFARVGASGA